MQWPQSHWSRAVRRTLADHIMPMQDQSRSFALFRMSGAANFLSRQNRADRKQDKQNSGECRVHHDL
jgi:hypothetical protein